MRPGLSRIDRSKMYSENFRHGGLLRLKAEIYHHQISLNRKHLEDCLDGLVSQDSSRGAALKLTLTHEVSAMGSFTLEA